MEGLKSTVLASPFDRVDVLVTTVVTSTGIALGILVRHGRAESIEDGAGGDVLRGDENYGFTLALNLAFLSTPQRGKQ